MLSYLLLGVVLLLIVLAAAHGFARADTKTLLLVIKWVGGVLAVLIGLYLIVSGRAFHVIWVALLVPAFWRMLRYCRLEFRHMRCLKMGLKGFHTLPAFRDAKHVWIVQFNAEGIVITTFLSAGSLFHCRDGWLQCGYVCLA